MTPLLARFGGWLVEPPASASPQAVPAVAASDPGAVEVAVLAAPADAPALAAALALRLAHGVAVVGAWPAARTAAGPATPRARRLAASLCARELPATAAGRLVTVRLPDVAAAARLRGGVGGAPLVLAVAGARDAHWDRLLVDCDLVAVHAREAAVAEVALARLAEQGAAAVRIDAAPGLAARALARAGLALPGGRTALGPALQAVGR